MFLNRASAVAALTLSIAGATTTINPNPWLPQSIAQNTNPPSRPNQRMPRWIQDLNLTPDQMQRMRQIQNQYKDRMMQSAQSLRQARQELQTMMAGTATQDQLRDKQRQVEALGQQLRQLRFESTIAMREILTPQQRRLLAERMQNHRRNSRNRPGNRGATSSPETAPPK